jgi:signal transduction histidine kinase
MGIFVGFQTSGSSTFTCMIMEFRKVWMLLLAIVFNCAYLSAQSPDSLLLTSENEKDEKAILYLINYVDSVTVTRSTDPMPLALKAFEMAQKSNSSMALGRAYFVLAQLHRFMTLDYRKAKDYFDLAIPLLKVSNDHLFHGRAIIGLAAMLQLERGNFKARSRYVDAMHILMSGDELSKAFAYESRGHQFYNEGQYDSMKYYLKKAQAILRRKNKILRCSYLLNIMTEEFISSKDMSLAEGTVRSLDSIAALYPIPYIKYLAEKSRANILISEKQFKEALVSLDKAVSYENTLLFPSPVTTKLYTAVAHCHNELSDWNQAKKFIDKALANAKKFTDVMSQAIVYKLKSEVFENQRKLDSALHYRKIVAGLNEKLFFDGQIRLKDLEATFMAEQKEKENHFLTQSLTLRNWLLVFAVMVLVLSLFLIVLQHRSRRRLRKLNMRLEDMNAEVTAQNEEMVAQNEQINIQNDQLIERARQVAEQSRLLELSYSNLKRLEAAGKRITSCLSPLEVIENCDSFIRHAIPVNQFGIAIYEEPNQRLFFPKVISTDGQTSFHRNLSDKRAMVVKSFVSKQFVLNNHSRADLADVKFQEEQYGSFIACPLVINDKAVGVMFANYKEENIYGDIQVDFIKNLANYCAIAIENSKNFQQVLDDQIRLAEAGALKDKLISIISHDLKGPMNSLKGFLMLLNSKNLSEEETDALILGLEKHFNHTLELIDSVLLWTKSQMSGLKVFPRNFDAIEPVQAVTGLLKEQAAAKTITIINNVHSSPVFADVTMVELILRNLISNAIKFTNPGGRVNVSTASSGEKVIFSVSDNGVGIPDNVLKVLMKGEQRFSSSGTANEKGTGLGLYLCKEFAEKLQGRLWAESQLGKGSIFYLELPASPAG